ncbi:MAG: sigma-70 family RNA polymerase sigma factor [Pseudomonadota bacterium]
MRTLNDAAEPARPAVDPSDEALLARIARRDKAAFETLFHRYAGRIRGVLAKTGAASDEAEEAMQETMLSIWRRADSFDPARASAAAWIFAIARNRRIDMLRRSRRPEPDPNDPLFQPEPPSSSEAEVAAAARDAKIREAVADLTEAQREAVRLAFFLGLSHPEIAARTGAPLGTVKSRLRLAAERLRTALGGSFDEETFGD